MSDNDAEIKEAGLEYLIMDGWLRLGFTSESGMKRFMESWSGYCR